jgi:hypothetical protein
MIQYSCSCSLSCVPSYSIIPEHVWLGSRIWPPLNLDAVVAMRSESRTGPRPMATELRQNAVHFFILLLLLLFLLLTVRSTAYCTYTVPYSLPYSLQSVQYGTVRSQYHTYHIIIPGYRGVSYVRMIVLTYTVNEYFLET